VSLAFVQACLNEGDQPGERVGLVVPQVDDLKPHELQRLDSPSAMSSTYEVPLLRAVAVNDNVFALINPFDEPERTHVSLPAGP
jgi:hypothetical protein